jgi:HYPK UBA domain
MADPADTPETETEQEQGLKAQARKDMQAVTAFVDDSSSRAGNSKDLTFLQKTAKLPPVTKSKLNLPDIKIDPAHLALVMDQLEMTKSEAEKLLRQKAGVVKECFKF